MADQVWEDMPRDVSAALDPTTNRKRVNHVRASSGGLRPATAEITAVAPHPDPMQNFLEPPLEDDSNISLRSETRRKLDIKTPLSGIEIIRRDICYHECDPDNPADASSTMS